MYWYTPKCEHILSRYHISYCKTSLPDPANWIDYNLEKWDCHLYLTTRVKREVLALMFCCARRSSLLGEQFSFSQISCTELQCSHFANFAYTSILTWYLSLYSVQVHPWSIVHHDGRFHLDWFPHLVRAPYQLAIRPCTSVHPPSDILTWMLAWW